MIIDIKKLTVIIVLMATLFVPCSLAAENPVAGILDKMPVYTKLLEELGIPENKTAYIGDDLVDLPIMSRCGFAISVADAMDEVRAAADLVTGRTGGRGAVAEAVRFLLQAAGDWETVMARYSQEAG